MAKIGQLFGQFVSDRLGRLTLMLLVMVAMRAHDPVQAAATTVALLEWIGDDRQRLKLP